MLTLCENKGTKVSVTYDQLPSILLILCRKWLFITFTATPLYMVIYKTLIHREKNSGTVEWCKGWLHAKCWWKVRHSNLFVHLVKGKMLIGLEWGTTQSYISPLWKGEWTQCVHIGNWKPTCHYFTMPVQRIDVQCHSPALSQPSYSFLIWCKNVKCCNFMMTVMTLFIS